MKNLPILIILLLVMSQPLAAEDQSTLTIFAASSLTDAFQDLADEFIAHNPNVDILFNFASSSALSSQLVEGAPADIFASANLRQMKHIVDVGRISDPIAIFARNRLIVAMPADNPANITTLMDIAHFEVKLILAAPGVPVREYTDLMLEKLAADPLYGFQYKQAFLANVVSEEENVRQVVAKIALGEADAGIVYQSDVTPELTDLITAFSIPEAVNILAAYPIAVTNDTQNSSLASAFLSFVLSDTGQDILAKWNFIGKCPAPINLNITPTPLPTAMPTAIPDPRLAGCPA